MTDAIRLVVNADDFGLDTAVSLGILQAHRAAVVTSTSVLGNCVELGAVVELLRGAPTLGVGAHLCLTAGTPVSPPERVASLLDEGGRLAGRGELLKRWALRRLSATEIEAEVDAQVQRLRDGGLTLDHLDVHERLGYLPVVGRAVESVARRYHIPGVRSTVEPPSLTWLGAPMRGMEAGITGGLAWLTRRQMGARRHGPQSWGAVVDAGRLDEVRVLEYLGRMGPGSHELVCHPGEQDDPLAAAGSGYARRQELDALLSPKVGRALELRKVELCRWGDLF